VNDPKEGAKPEKYLTSKNVGSTDLAIVKVLKYFIKSYIFMQKTPSPYLSN
jgi:hypothetical protein